MDGLLTATLQMWFMLLFLHSSEHTFPRSNPKCSAAQVQEGLSPGSDGGWAGCKQSPGRAAPVQDSRWWPVLKEPGFLVKPPQISFKFQFSSLQKKAKLLCYFVHFRCKMGNNDVLKLGSSPSSPQSL